VKKEKVKMSMKNVLSVLAMVAAIGGFVAVNRVHAQSLPSSTACIASCGIAQGDCASAVAQANQACVTGCASLRGSAVAGCAQACAQAVGAGINECKATFSACVTSCSVG
jgi:hypothetical protein